MPTSFFIDWALWQQMTFVLACLIVIVFLAGWVRLWWISRRNKKFAILDEEKRVKIQELRKRGHIVKSKLDNDVPFGVRAIESGIEIDGIWVSRSNTPVPESLRSFRNSRSSSASSIKSNDTTKATSSMEGSPRMELISEAPLHTFRNSQLALGQIVAGESLHPPDRETLSWHQTATYKPRRSSQLRFSSNADIHMHMDTLSHLEGTISTNPPEQTHHRKTSHTASIVADSFSDTAAKNERSSNTDSEDSVSSNEANIGSHSVLQSDDAEASEQLLSKDKGRAKHKSTDSITSITLSSTGDHFTIPLESPPRPSLNPFVTADASPHNLTSIPMRVTNRLPTSEIEALGESQWPLLSGRRPTSPEEPLFMPGSIHVNTSYRRVNSGFEILPAGTFDTPVDSNGIDQRGIGTQLGEDNKGKRRSKRLQKKGRDPMTKR